MEVLKNGDKITQTYIGDGRGILLFCRGMEPKILALGLSQAKDLGIRKVLITCNKSNISSAKVILKNSGMLENEVVEEGEIIQRYWVDLD